MNIQCICTPTVQKVGNIFVAVTECANKVSEFVLSVFEFVGEIFSKISNQLGRIFAPMRTFADVTGLVSLIKRAQDWSSGPTGILTILGSSFQSAGNVLSFISFIDKMRWIRLGVAFTPIKQAADICSIAACVCEIWDCSRKLIASKSIVETAERKLTWWSQRRDEGLDKTREVIESKIDAWKKVRDGDEKERHEEANTRIHKWETILNRCDSPEKMTNYCAAKANRSSVKIRNQPIENERSWKAIILDIASIAFLALGLLLPLLVTGFAATMAVISLGLLLTSLDLSFLIWDFIKKPADLPVVALP